MLTGSKVLSFARRARCAVFSALLDGAVAFGSLVLLALEAQLLDAQKSVLAIRPENMRCARGLTNVTVEPYLEIPAFSKTAT